MNIFNLAMIHKLSFILLLDVKNLNVSLIMASKWSFFYLRILEQNFAKDNFKCIPRVVGMRYMEKTPNQHKTQFLLTLVALQNSSS